MLSKEIIMKLNIGEGSFIASLTTFGRKTGKLHTVLLRLVFHNDKLYASRRSMNGDWLQNLLKNSHVIIEINGEKINGKAALLEDKKLLDIISSLKYNDERALMERIVIEITPG